MAEMKSKPEEAPDKSEEHIQEDRGLAAGKGSNAQAHDATPQPGGADGPHELIRRIVEKVKLL